MNNYKYYKREYISYTQYYRIGKDKTLIRINMQNGNFVDGSYMQICKEHLHIDHRYDEITEKEFKEMYLEFTNNTLNLVNE